MIAPTASQIVDDSTPPSNAGCRTRSVTRPRATVTATDARAKTNAPATEIRNGFGWVQTCEAISRIPRPNRPRGSSSTIVDIHP